MKVKYIKTSRIKPIPNNNSSDIISGNFINGCLGGCWKSYCVEEGSLISTKYGLVPVEKIQNGDLVQSYNSLKEQVELKKAYRKIHRQSYSWIEIEVAGQVIVVTPEHPFYIVGKGWVEAQYLTVDDEVLYDDDHITE